MAPTALTACPAAPAALLDEPEYVSPHWLYCAWCRHFRRATEDGAEWECCTEALFLADLATSSHGACPDCCRRLRAEAVHLTPITWERYSP